jgi:hypothetical protein
VWGSFESTYGPSLRGGVDGAPALIVFAVGDETGEKQWEDFRKRVIEHVSASYWGGLA